MNSSFMSKFERFSRLICLEFGLKKNVLIPKIDKFIEPDRFKDSNIGRF